MYRDTLITQQAILTELMKDLRYKCLLHYVRIVVNEKDSSFKLMATETLVSNLKILLEDMRVVVSDAESVAFFKLLNSLTERYCYQSGLSAQEWLQHIDYVATSHVRSIGLDNADNQCAQLRSVLLKNPWALVLLMIEQLCTNG